MYTLFNLGCDVDDLKADVVALLDSSGSMGQPDFAKEVSAVHSLANYFTLSADHVQIGSVAFSSDIKSTTESLMNRYNHLHDPKRIKGSMLTAIDYMNIIVASGGTGTAKALRHVMDHSFTVAAGDRPDVPNILIVMTDGASDHKVSYFVVLCLFLIFDKYITDGIQFHFISIRKINLTIRFQIVCQSKQKHLLFQCLYVCHCLWTRNKNIHCLNLQSPFYHQMIPLLGTDFHIDYLLTRVSHPQIINILFTPIV